MADRRLGLIMHGVTGRMGYNQHLVRSILAIRDQGGVVLSNGDRLVVDPIIVGRDADKSGWPKSTTSSAGAAISMRRWPILTTRYSSMPARR